jgi:dCMP deaminase
MYVSMFPCNECAKLIIQSDIKRVVYLCDKYSHTDQVRAAKILFQMGKVTTEQFVPKRNKIEINFESFLN